MNLTVLCGGLSNERDVSISTGAGAARALRALGHRVALADLYLGVPALPEPIERAFTTAEAETEAAIAETAPDLEQVKALRPHPEVRIGPNVLALCRASDLVFLALHGEEGENGKLQGLLDLYGVRYTGAGSLGSALAMNKAVSKALMRQAGIPTPEGLLLQRDAPRDAPPWLPCVVKPCSGGSSVGTSIVHHAADYAPALALAFRYEKQVLVERCIWGRELTVGLMDGAAMPVIEIIPKSGFYDYKNKYQAGATTELCPAPIGPEATARVQALAERAYRCLGLEAYARADFLWDTAADEFYCIELNTLPGMTPTSLIPQMAAAEGLDYPGLCAKIMEVSLKKYEKPAD
ncbi:MAG: D-alanine--D-alanine ligase [Oscillospiraceae bacterium]|nr:D-alanine--D-alanine ligase [Oscillospiraceae bacterium]